MGCASEAGLPGQIHCRAVHFLLADQIQIAFSRQQSNVYLQIATGSCVEIQIKDMQRSTTKSKLYNLFTRLVFLVVRRGVHTYHPIH
jgi:hypothetical protein